MYRNTDEIEKLKKIKADSDKEMMEALQKLKELSESNAALKEELDELKVAAQAVVDIVEIPKDNANEPLSLAGKLQKVPQCFLRYVSETTQ
jgi:formiminotetrahydrofolate cyclodeaminase